MDRLGLPTAVVDFRREEVRGADGTRIGLRPRAFAVLRCLAAHAERLVTKDDLLAECWPGVVVTEDSLTQCVSEIRQALGEGARDVVRTVPRRGYVLMPPERTASTSENIQASVPASSGFWPAIAVLPFDEFSDKPGPLGAGIAAEIITELARNRDLKVVSRHTSFGAAAQGLLPADLARTYQTRYVLEGGIRWADERVIVGVQLIDCHDSRHIWAERFVASPDELFAAQNGLVHQIAARLFAEVREAEMTAALHRVPADLDACQLTLLGGAHLRLGNHAGFIKARAALERAVVLDPHHALARVYLSGLNAYEAALGVSGELGLAGLPAAIAELEQAIASAPASARTLRILGEAFCLAGRSDEGLRVLEKASALGPNNTDVMALLGYSYMQVGDYELGLSHVERAFALNSNPSPVYYGIIAYGLLAIGRLEESLTHAVEGIRRAPGYPAPYLEAACALSAVGRAKEAAAHTTGLLDHCPRLSMQIPVIQAAFSHVPERRERYLDHLRAAGLPEGT